MEAPLSKIESDRNNLARASARQYSFGKIAGIFLIIGPPTFSIILFGSGAAIWSLSEEKRTSPGHLKSVAFDPSRHLATANCRIAERSLALLRHGVLDCALFATPREK
jgi:hypothetical protein